MRTMILIVLVILAAPGALAQRDLAETGRPHGGKTASIAAPG